MHRSLRVGIPPPSSLTRKYSTDGAFESRHLDIRVCVFSSSNNDNYLYPANSTATNHGSSLLRLPPASCLRSYHKPSAQFGPQHILTLTFDKRTRQQSNPITTTTIRPSTNPASFCSLLGSPAPSLQCSCLRRRAVQDD